MYELLAKKFTKLFQSLQHKKTITEKNIKSAIVEVRLALLEADVDYYVVQKIVREVEEQSIGKKIIQDISPDQKFIKILQDQLTDILGQSQEEVNIQDRGMSLYMMTGIQGSGKTTVSGKLAYFFKKTLSKKVLLVACDLYRPAAIEQLQTVAEKIDVDFYAQWDTKKVIDVAENALKKANQGAYDIVIFDTAGRLSIDEDMMEELRILKTRIKPTETIHVLDAMMGQTSLKSAKEFEEKVSFDSCIVTKMDGDARGGLVLSICYAMKKPIKFIGTGEKMENLEIFHPSRVASRILGMGDIVSLVEKAESVISKEESERLEKKLKTKGFNYKDFINQLKKVRSMGPLKDLMGLIPGLSALKEQEDLYDEKELIYIEAMVCSMTEEEREQPVLINKSRRERIARGCGLSYKKIAGYMEQFSMMNKLFMSMNGTNMDSQDLLKKISGGDMSFMNNLTADKKTMQHKKSSSQKKKKKKKNFSFPKLPF